MCFLLTYSVWSYCSHACVLFHSLSISRFYFLVLYPLFQTWVGSASSGGRWVGGMHGPLCLSLYSSVCVSPHHCASEALSTA